MCTTDVTAGYVEDHPAWFRVPPYPFAKKKSAVVFAVSRYALLSTIIATSPATSSLLFFLLLLTAEHVLSDVAGCVSHRDEMLRNLMSYLPGMVDSYGKCENNISEFDDPDCASVPGEGTLTIQPSLALALHKRTTLWRCVRLSFTYIGTSTITITTITTSSNHLIAS
jgi:hypothetical protein